MVTNNSALEKPAVKSFKNNFWVSDLHFTTPYFLHELCCSCKKYPGSICNDKTHGQIRRRPYIQDGFESGCELGIDEALTE